jgi:hypothetical protein
MFALVTFLAACIDLGQQYSGSVSGLMNTFGNLGGFFSPMLGLRTLAAVQFRPGRHYSKGLECYPPLSSAQDAFAKSSP